MLHDAALDQTLSSREILLAYDEECPICDAYCHMVRIRDSIGTLKLVNARDAGEAMNEITLRGLDIDQGMVLKVDDVLYYGSDAIFALASMSSASGPLNRMNHWLFRSRARARILYPVLRVGRNLLLKVMRKAKINNLGRQGNDRF